ncbi:MAG: cytochrome c maturation protein CcmE [Solirubrobacteraceae bacterium]|nr:cytochrome c maturation protein CcmE [Patulibacter sp.]
MQVSRSRRRTVRFSIALTLAILLAGALVYTTFTAASPERFPDQLATSATPGQTYQVGGRVLASTRHGSSLTMTLGHPGTGAGKPIQITYDGTVPDPYRIGRDILIQVKQDPANSTEFVGQGNSLVTKCPSKFNGAEMNADTGTPVKPSVADQASAAS